MRTLLQDVQYSLRILLKNPGLNAVAIMMVALGICASATIFSFVDALFFRPLPVRDPATVVRAYAAFKGSGFGTFSYPEYAYFRDHNSSFNSLAAHYSYAPLNVFADGETTETQGAVVSANYFATLGVKPLVGRFFLPAEDAVPDRDGVAVISFEYWQLHFAGDASIIGKQIKINGKDFAIIGVAPKEFHGVLIGTPNNIWIPTMMLRAGYRWCDSFQFDCRPLQLIGRLASGHTIESAQAELALLASQLAAANPKMEEGRGVILQSSSGAEPTEQRDSSYQMDLLMAVAGLLLLIACANVAGLLLVRGTARRKEIAVRLSLGASRLRLVRQLVTESITLALLGGTLGLVLTLWTKSFLLGFYAIDTEGYVRSYDLSLDWRVLLYAILLSIITGLLFGLTPALQSSRPDVVRALKDEGGRQSSSRHRLRDALIVAQVALSLALLVAAGLLARSASNIRSGMNFDPARVALLRLRPQLLQYPPEKAQAFTREVVHRLEGLPGVQSVSLAKGKGLAWLSTGDTRVWLPGRAPNRPDEGLAAKYHEIAPRFFETLKIPLIEGRDFDERDRPGSPRVTIINQTLAQRLWADSSPLGRPLVFNNQEYEVVGVFKDSGLHSAIEAPAAFLYISYWQNNLEPQVDSRMVVRVASDPASMLPELRRVIAAVDANVPVAEEMPMSEQVNGKYASVIMSSTILVSSSVLALLFSMVGLYGALAFAVSQRTRELGIRMALGAQAGDLLTMVIKQGMSLVAVGSLVGLAGAYGLARVIASLLFGVTATDPLIYLLTPLGLLLIALLACYIPARRATRVDPLVALRYE